MKICVIRCEDPVQKRPAPATNKDNRVGGLRHFRMTRDLLKTPAYTDTLGHSHARTHARTCAHACTLAHKNTHVHMQACARTYTRTHTHTHTHTRTRTRTRHTHTPHTHTHTHTHSHTHIHTPVIHICTSSVLLAVFLTVFLSLRSIRRPRW